MKRGSVMRRAVLFVAGWLVCMPAAAQFIDEFTGPATGEDLTSPDGWATVTGDGGATMLFRQGDGYGAILIDATYDRHGIWWAFIRHNVAPALDLSLLSQPGYELRIETRVRFSHAPRRVNLHLNTQKTTDFHSHLMEYDIPNTEGWHTISFTTKDFEAEPGDRVNAQIAMIDWGPEIYRVDVDYYKVDVVKVSEAGPDLGSAVPYHPPIPPLSTFAHHVSVSQDAMVDTRYTDINFNDWYVTGEKGKTSVLTVNGTQYPILRWDFSAFTGKQVADHGVLELTTHSVQRVDAGLEEFGKVRIVEILAGDPRWDQETVTYESFMQGQPLEQVFNTQMIYDTTVIEESGGKTLVTISKPVLQRLVDGKTKGIAIRPLGSINAAFYSMEEAGGRHAARLYVNVKE